MQVCRASNWNREVPGDMRRVEVILAGSPIFLGREWLPLGSASRWDSSWMWVLESYCVFDGNTIHWWGQRVAFDLIFFYPERIN